MHSLQRLESRHCGSMTNHEWRTRLLVAEPNYFRAVAIDSNEYFFSNLLRHLAATRRERDTALTLARNQSAFREPLRKRAEVKSKVRARKFDIASVILPPNRLSIHYTLPNLKRIYYAISGNRQQGEAAAASNDDDEYIDVD